MNFREWLQNEIAGSSGAPPSTPGPRSLYSKYFYNPPAYRDFAKGEDRPTHAKVAGAWKTAGERGLFGHMYSHVGGFPPPLTPYDLSKSIELDNDGHWEITIPANQLNGTEDEDDLRDIAIQLTRFSKEFGKKAAAMNWNSAKIADLQKLENGDTFIKISVQSL